MDTALKQTVNLGAAFETDEMYGKNEYNTL